MHRITPALLFVLALALPASPAPDTFHLIKIREFFPGSTVAPNAQYIVLQMYFAGQNLVSGHAVRIFDSLGGLITSFTFPGDVGNGADQATILIATTAAATFFGVTADLTMTPVIPLRGGKICFDIANIDCVSWGNYSGTAVGTGTPFNSPYPLPLGKAVKRDLRGNGTLEAGDDSNDSETDFFFGLPAPRNNGGISGTIPPSTCGNGTLEGLEQCDDGNTTAGDGCDPLCALEPICGNGILEAGEECDDGNTNSGDGCSATCQIEGDCAVLTTGDVNVSGTITSADIIGLVNFVFKGGATPQPCEGAGDVNCSGTVTSADIIGLVNFVFKGGAPPCDVCALVPGTWSC
jgi:cysteine-rich repeat protein